MKSCRFCGHKFIELNKENICVFCFHIYNFIKSNPRTTYIIIDYINQLDERADRNKVTTSYTEARVEDKQCSTQNPAVKKGGK